MINSIEKTNSKLSLPNYFLGYLRMVFLDPSSREINEKPAGQPAFARLNDHLRRDVGIDDSRVIKRTR